MVKIIPGKLIMSASRDQLFAQYAFPRGGAVDLEAPDGSVELGLDLQVALAARNVLRRDKRVNRNGEALKIEFGVFGDIIPNGLAEHVGDVHFCAITFGHYLNSLGISIHLLRHTQWMPDIGTPTSTPMTTVMTLAPGRAFMEKVRSAAPRMLEPWSNDDPDRMEAALILRYTMTSIVLAHEYHHAALGHCDVVQNLGLAAGLRETGSTGHVLEDEHLYKWFEYLADQAAVDQVLSLIEAGLDPLINAGPLASNLLFRFRMVIVAAGLVAGMWHSYALRFVSPDIYHPAPKQRLTLLLRTVRNTLLEQGHDLAYVDQVEDLALADLAEISRYCPGLDKALS